MKIVLDVEKLLAEGRITTEEYTRLNALAVQETGSMAFNLLIALGVKATAIGLLALLPSGETAILIGILMFAAGYYLTVRYSKEWGLLGVMLLLVGSLSASGGILFVTEASALGFSIVTVLYLLGAFLAKSGSFAVMAVFAFWFTVATILPHGRREFIAAIRQPTLAITLFSLLAFGVYQLSKRLRAEDQRIAIIIARTCLFIVNIAFWIGSLQGDLIGNVHIADPNVRLPQPRGLGIRIPDWFFTVVWAIALLITGIWASKANKRWVVNLLGVFAVIHFYTQQFIYMGASPRAFLIAGLSALGIALIFFKYNKKAVDDAVAGVMPPKNNSPYTNDRDTFV